MLFQDASVVLTGCTGFVGIRTLAKLLRDTQVSSVILPVRTNDKNPSAEQRFARLCAAHKSLKIRPSDKRLCIVPVDQRDGASGLANAIARAPADVRNKCAAFLHVASCTDWDISLADACSANLHPTVALMREAQSERFPNMSHFVYCSTAFVQPLHMLNKPLGQCAAEPYSPDHQYFSPYAASKAMTEEAIAKWASEQSKQSGSKAISVTVLRPSTVGGSMGLDGVTKGWTSDFKSVAGGFFLLSKASPLAKHSNVAPVPAERRSHIIPVDLVANALILAAHKHNANPSAVTYLNASPEEHLNVTWRRVVKHVRKGLVFAETAQEFDALVRTDIAQAKNDMDKKVVEKYMKSLRTFVAATMPTFDFETDLHGLHDDLTDTERRSFPLQLDESVIDAYFRACVRNVNLRVKMIVLRRFRKRVMRRLMLSRSDKRRAPKPDAQKSAAKESRSHSEANASVHSEEMVDKATNFTDIEANMNISTRANSEAAVCQ